MDESKLSTLIEDHLQAIQASYESLSEQNNEKDLFLMGLRQGLERCFPSAMGSPHIASDIVACIGQTKLVRIHKLHSEGCVAEVVAKLEFTNPALSVKDRIAREMIEVAEREGKIQPGVHTIVDITSGNTGIAYGMVAASKGYDAIQIIPEAYSMERRALMMAMGVQVVVSQKADGILGALKVYQETLDQLGDKAFAPRQFDNPANLKAHMEHTGPEIWEQTGGKIDCIVAGMGTGGTISGITKFLRSKNPDFKAIAVEPMESSLLNGDKPGPHGIQGISPPFLPPNVLVEELDEVIRCSTADAMATAKELAQQEGIACGISAGANVWAALQVAKRPDMKGKRIVTILCSAAERYFSTPLYESLLEEAKGLPMATFHPDTPTDGITMHTFESHKASGTVFRPGFKVV